jgi:hypothetical protein
MALNRREMTKSSFPRGVHEKYPSCELWGWGYVAHMGWQEITALLVVAVTAFAFGWNRFRPKKLSFQRNGPCGCSASTSNPSKNSIVYTGRKGEPARIVVKMR